jgi:hypothetical protein
MDVYTHKESIVVALISNNILSAYDIINNREFFSVEFEVASLMEIGR